MPTLPPSLDLPTEPAVVPEGKDDNDVDHGKAPINATATAAGKKGGKKGGNLRARRDF